MDGASGRQAATRVFNVDFAGNQQAGIAGSQSTVTPWLIVGSQFVGNGSYSEVGFSSAGIKGTNAYTILNSYVADNIGTGIGVTSGASAAPGRSRQTPSSATRREASGTRSPTPAH